MLLKWQKRIVGRHIWWNQLAARHQITLGRPEEWCYHSENYYQTTKSPHHHIIFVYNIVFSINTKECKKISFQNQRLPSTSFYPDKTCSRWKNLHFTGIANPLIALDPWFLTHYPGLALCGWCSDGYKFHWLGMLPLWVREVLTCSMVSSPFWVMQSACTFEGWKQTDNMDLSDRRKRLYIISLFIINQQ